MLHAAFSVCRIQPARLAACARVQGVSSVCRVPSAGCALYAGSRVRRGSGWFSMQFAGCMGCKVCSVHRVQGSGCSVQGVQGQSAECSVQTPECSVCRIQPARRAAVSAQSAECRVCRVGTPRHILGDRVQGIECGTQAVV